MPPLRVDLYVNKQYTNFYLALINMRYEQNEIECFWVAALNDLFHISISAQGQSNDCYDKLLNEIKVYNFTKGTYWIIPLDDKCVYKCL